MIYNKLSYETFVNSLNTTQRAILKKVILNWSDKQIELDDTEFNNLPALAQTKLTTLITRLGYS